VPAIGAQVIESSVQAANAPRPLRASQEGRPLGSACGTTISATTTRIQAPSPAHARGSSKYPPLKNASTVGPAISAAHAAYAACFATGRSGPPIR